MFNIALGKGGCYAGPSIKKILRKTLDDLEQMLPPEYGKPATEFLRATSQAYELCMAKNVPSPDSTKPIFDEFRRTFLVLKNLLSLSATLKVHIISGEWSSIKLHINNTFFLFVDHTQEYFRMTGRTFRHTSGEYVETTHSKLRKMEEKSNLQVRKEAHGSSTHLDRLLRSTCLWNYRVLGKEKGKKTNPQRPEVIGAAAALHDHSY